MNKNLLSLLAMCLFSISTIAQNTVQLNINHKLGDDAFAMEQASENNLGNYFKVNRLEYYVSQITITHDGGLETAVEDLHILVNAAEETEVDLGSHNITEVENISYYIGVDPDVNHNDPSAYPNGHPLAPTFPSMHWGWASGYRFIAFEGKSGSQNNQQTVELHCLGDNNYFESNIDVSVTAENNMVLINIDADYNKVLEDLDVSTGMIVHGEGASTKKAVENFRDFVFSPSPISPTPTIGMGTESGEGNYEITATSDNTEDVFQWVVTDSDGNELTIIDGVAFAYDFEFNDTYTLTLTVTGSNGETAVETQEVTITSAMTVGIEDLTNINAVELYPVPANNFINLALTLNDVQTMNITITNVLGQTVSIINQKVFTQGINLIKINTTDFTNGLYFVNVETAGQMATQRFVISK